MENVRIPRKFKKLIKSRSCSMHCNKKQVRVVCIKHYLKGYIIGVNFNRL